MRKAYKTDLTDAEWDLVKETAAPAPDRPAPAPGRASPGRWPPPRGRDPASSAPRTGPPATHQGASAAAPTPPVPRGMRGCPSPRPGTAPPGPAAAPGTCCSCRTVAGAPGSLPAAITPPWLLPVASDYRLRAGPHPPAHPRLAAAALSRARAARLRRPVKAGQPDLLRLPIPRHAFPAMQPVNACG